MSNDDTIDDAWLDCTAQFTADWRRGGPAPSERECGELIDKMIAEIRRLKEVIKKRNYCVDCGKLNTIDNVCDDCLEVERTGHDQRAEDQASYNAGISAGLKGR